MRRHVKHVTVLGSGVMGSGIACHFANIGVEVLMSFFLFDSKYCYGIALVVIDLCRFNN